MIKKSSPPLVLIDGSSYLYRAFHAFPPLTAPDGTPTGAIYGVINMLRSLLRQFSPTHVAVIFDAPGKTWRHDLYSDYKGHRPEMPEDLRSQIVPLHKIIQAMGLAILSVPHVEADDLIGTIARLSEDQGDDVLIITSDKDMVQLVNHKISLVNTMTNVVLGPDEVRKRYGIEPTLMADFLALVGDTSDNIPGVPGIGPKKAVALLNGFGGVKEIYAQLEQVSRLDVRGAKSLAITLAQHQDSAIISRRLATIDTAIPLGIQRDDFLLQQPDRDSLREFFGRYAFKSWLAELSSGVLAENMGGRDTKPDIDTKSRPLQDKGEKCTTRSGCRIILTEMDLSDWLQKLRSVDCFALSVAGDRPLVIGANLVGITFAISSGEAAYLPLGHDSAAAPTQLDHKFALAQLKELFNDATAAKVGHDLKISYQLLALRGIELRGITIDAMLASYVLDSVSGRHDDLHSIAKRHLGHEIEYKASPSGRGAKQIAIKNLAPEEVANQTTENMLLALQLCQALKEKVQTETRALSLMRDIEMPLIPILARMEIRGVLIDNKILAQQSVELQDQMRSIELETYQQVGAQFNLNSTKQLQKILFEDMKLPCLRKTPKGAPSTDESVLTGLANHNYLPGAILRYRTLAKLKSTYTDKLPKMISPETGRLHTSYHQAITATGRLSSSDPNLQNIPIKGSEGRQIRRAFIAPEGYCLVSADYSQIELRIMAHLSQDQRLLQAFSEGLDVHRATAAEIFNVPMELVSSQQRRSAKTINFGLIYGMSPFGLAQQLRIGRSKAENYVQRYFERYPGVQNYMEMTRKKAMEQGYVETIWGRRLWLPEINASQGARRRGAERAAINAPMQGSAADIIKRAMIAIDCWIQQQLEGTAYMIMQVHDELIFEVRQDAIKIAVPQIQNFMEHSSELSVPMSVSVGIGDNWDQAH